MYIENLTQDNIMLFPGIGVPASGILSVDAEMEHAITTSPLVAEYVAASMLKIVKTPVAEEAAPVVEPTATVTAKSK